MLRIGNCAGQPFVDKPARFGSDHKKASVELSGSILACVGAVIQRQLEKHGHFIFKAFAEYWRHADLARRFFALRIVFDDVFRLGAQRGGDVHRCTAKCDLPAGYAAA